MPKRTDVAALGEPPRRTSHLSWRGYSIPPTLRTPSSMRSTTSRRCRRTDLADAISADPGQGQRPQIRVGRSVEGRFPTRRRDRLSASTGTEPAGSTGLPTSSMTAISTSWPPPSARWASPGGSFGKFWRARRRSKRRSKWSPGPSTRYSTPTTSRRRRTGPRGCGNEPCTVARCCPSGAAGDRQRGRTGDAIERHLVPARQRAGGWRAPAGIGARCGATTVMPRSVRFGTW